MACGACALVWAEHHLEMPVLVEHYETREPTAAVRRGRVPLFDAFLDEAGRRISPRPGRLLDVGCGWGDFVERAVRRGWEACGVEPSRRIADDASRRGLRVRPSTLQNLPSSWSGFDLITYWDVFMYVDDPVRELRRALARLAPDGALYMRLRQHAILRYYDRFWQTAGRRLGFPNPVVYQRFNYAPRTMKVLGKILTAERPLTLESRPARLSRGDPYGSFQRDWPVRAAKGMIAAIADLAHAVSGGHLILSPSMEVWIRPR